MSTLTSASTLAQVKAVYFDNADYEEAVSITKAAAFITACRYLVLMLPQRARHGSQSSGEEIQLDLNVIEKQLIQAQLWKSANTTGAAGQGAVRFLSFEDDFR